MVTESVSIIDQLDELLECSICSDIYDDPRILPCVHSFCLRCLQQYCKDVRPGGSSPCPLCRKRFTVSAGGVQLLQKNIFVGMLKDLKDSYQRRACGFHNDKLLEIYCFDCKCLICVGCYFSVHRLHRCTDNINMATALSDDGICTENTPDVNARCIISGDKSISGITCCDDKLFLVRYKSQHVEIYDAYLFVPEGTLHIPGLGAWSWTMTCCTTNNCLYISDCENTVHRYGLTDKSCISWSVGGSPTGLSVTNSSNLLVTCCSDDKIQEYETNGSLVREISLQSHMVCPHHAVLLESGQIVVTHGWEESRHRICMANENGLIVRRYGNRKGDGLGRLCLPKNFVVLKSGKIIVVDHGNNRLVVLNSLLKNPYDLPVDVEGGLKGPWTLHLDETRDRLFVAEETGGRVIVIDNLCRRLSDRENVYANYVNVTHF